MLIKMLQERQIQVETHVNGCIHVEGYIRFIKQLSESVYVGIRRCGSGNNAWISIKQTYLSGWYLFTYVFGRSILDFKSLPKNKIYRSDRYDGSKQSRDV